MPLVEDAFNTYSAGSGFLTGLPLAKAIQASGGNLSLAQIEAVKGKKVDMAGFKTLVSDFTKNFAEELRQAFRVFDRGNWIF